MIEVAEEAQRMRAQKVIVTQILLSRLVQDVLIREHQLDDGQAVEDGHRQHVVQVQVGLLGQNARVFPGQVAQVNHGLVEEYLAVELDVVRRVVFRLVEGDVVVWKTGCKGKVKDTLKLTVI